MCCPVLSVLTNAGDRSRSSHVIQPSLTLTALHALLLKERHCSQRSYRGWGFARAEEERKSVRAEDTGEHRETQQGWPDPQGHILVGVS